MPNQTCIGRPNADDSRHAQFRYRFTHRSQCTVLTALRSTPHPVWPLNHTEIHTTPSLPTYRAQQQNSHGVTSTTSNVSLRSAALAATYIAPVRRARRPRPRPRSLGWGDEMFRGEERVCPAGPRPPDTPHRPPDVLTCHCRRGRMNFLGE